MKVHNEEETHQESRLQWLFLLLALVINGIILFCIFLITTDTSFLKFQPTTDQPSAPVVFEQMPQPTQQPPPPSAQQTPEQPKLDEVAALKPGAANFGMPDEFKEDEMVTNLVTPPEEENYEEALQELEAAQEEAEEGIEPTSNQEEPQHKNEPTHETLFPATIALPQTPQPKTIPEKPKDEKISVKKASETQKESHPHTIQQPPQVVRAPLEKKLTFNDLAQGFLSSLDEGGNDLMERKGNENIRPDFEEMRYLSYLHKIIWHMQNEWRRDAGLISSGIPAMVVTGISVTIDKDGNLKNSKIVQSCGNYQLDDGILRGIKTASPYPPLPTYLKKDVLTIEFGVKHVPAMQNKFNFR